MTPEERFNKFFEALQKSNPIWFDNLKVPFGKKDFAAAAQEVWLILHSEGKITKDMDWQYARSLMQRKLTWAPDKDQVIAPPKAEVVIHPEALTGEAKQARLNEFLAAVQSAPILKPQRKLTTEMMTEEGGVRPKATPFVRSAVETILAAKEAVKDAQKARRKLFLEAFPDASEEEIQAYIMKFVHIDNPDNI